MLLTEVARNVGVRDLGSLPAIDIVDLTHDSRQVADGSMFACVSGTAHDGHLFAAEAISRGAVALVVDHELGLDVPELVVEDVRQALGPLAAAIHGQPSTKIPVIGVTGTNGKTTVTHLLGGILESAGLEPEVLGTLSGARTTPEGTDLQRILAKTVAAGARSVAMEVSSHALALHRVSGTRFTVSLFTNLGLDHLDFHETFDAYFAAKATLFDASMSAVGVVCRDDSWGQRLLDGSVPGVCPMVSYGMEDVADLEMGSGGSSFVWRGTPVKIRLQGRHNVLNAVGAATAASELGIANEVIAVGLALVTAVRGRFEPVLDTAGIAGDVDVIVDYAHKPDALEAVLRAAGEIARGRVVVVIGAGGDRDKGKRPVMGRIAAELADLAIITSDNPRSEDPRQIIEEMLAGIEDRSNVSVLPDRAEAIAASVLNARPGDFVVLAGKGHETTQTSGEAVIDFDDAEHAARALTERRAKA